MSSKPFLFVNKDSSSNSLTRSTAKEQSSINSHVQRGRRHRRPTNPTRRRPAVKKEENPPTESSSSASATSPSSSASSTSIPIRATGYNTFVLTPDGGHKYLPPEQDYHDPTRPVHDRQAAGRISTAQQTSDDLVSFATPDPSSYDSEIRRTTSLTPLTSVAASPYDITQLASNPIDPFRKSSIAIDQQSHQLIQYYKLVYHPAVWHVETTSSRAGSYAFQTSSADVIRSALQSDVDMYALLACMAARQEFVDRRPGQGTEDYLGKALSATRRLLLERAYAEPKTLEEILMIIFHLYAAEGYRENVAAARIHMKGAKTIVAALGGLRMVRDLQMRELLIIGDGLLSALALAPCELPCEFDPGPYLTATPHELRINAVYDLSDIATALRDQPRTSIIPAPIQHLIEETAEINWVLSNAKDGTPEASKHAMRWIQMRSMAVRHRLLGLGLSDLRLDIVRVALVLWIVTTTTLLGQKKIGPVISGRLRQKLRHATSQKLEWKAHNDIKAWVLSLGAMCARLGTPESTWFAVKLNALMGSLAADWELAGESSQALLAQKVRQLQERFFYHDAVYGPWSQDLARKLVELSGPNSKT